MSAVSPSLYESIQLIKNGKSFPISGVDEKTRTVSFDYYESIFSPVVSANISLLDTGRLSSRLPIEGNESVSFSIRSKLGVLDYTKTPLKLLGAPVGAKDPNREIVAMSLMSDMAIQNLKTTISDKYTGKISDSVRKILKDHLGVPSEKLSNIDGTSNSYKFLGSSKDAFKIIIELCQKSIPYGSDDIPGYFFYENQRGIHFKSISKLISQEPYPIPYVYNTLLKTDETHDYRILSYTASRNQTTLNALKSGVYCTRNIFFDPRKLEYKELIFRITSEGNMQLGDKNIKKPNTLGKKVKVSDDFVKEDSDFTRTHFHILDVGMMDTKSTDVNNSAMEWQAYSTARYNILFSKILNIVVPCNPNLLAGGLINVLVKGDDEYDDIESGKYLIVNLCHHFDTTRSYTSLTLAKDMPG
jgi:hypothetical protein